jgi:hypothetical protein
VSDLEKRDHLVPPPPGYAAGIFFLVWATIGWYGVLFSPALMASFRAPGLDPGPAVLPIIVSTALTAGGAWLVLRGIATRHSGIKRMPLHVTALPVLFLLSAFLTTAFMKGVGFQLSGFVFAAVWLIVLNAQQKVWGKRIGFSLILAAIIITIMRLVFVHLLRVPLP